MNRPSSFNNRSAGQRRTIVNNKIIKSSEKKKQKSEQCKLLEADIERYRTSFKVLLAGKNTTLNDPTPLNKPQQNSHNKNDKHTSTEENINGDQVQNSSNKQNTAPSISYASSILKKGQTSSSKKVHFSDNKLGSSPSKQFSSIARNLFNNDKILTPLPLKRTSLRSEENVLEFMVTDDPDIGVLNSSNMSVDDKHNSSLEYLKYEFLCNNKKEVEPLPVKQDISTELGEFIEAQNTQLYDKIAILIKEHTETILAKIALVQGHSVTESSAADAKVEVPSQKRKVNDLRVNVIKKTMGAIYCPDTPSTSKKMKVATDMYNCFRKDLDSPCEYASALADTTIDKQAPKSALSRIIQKQCLSLVE